MKESFILFQSNFSVGEFTAVILLVCYHNPCAARAGLAVPAVHQASQRKQQSLCCAVAIIIVGYSVPGTRGRKSLIGSQLEELKGGSKLPLNVHPLHV